MGAISGRSRSLQHADIEAVVTDVSCGTEQGLECPELTAFLPNWFECDVQEFRNMVAGQFITFTELEPRTNVDIVISYFQDRFQMSSAVRARENFKYVTQTEDESVEEWDIRVDRIK